MIDWTAARTCYWLPALPVVRCATLHHYLRIIYKHWRSPARRHMPWMAAWCKGMANRIVRRRSRPHNRYASNHIRCIEASLGYNGSSRPNNRSPLHAKHSIPIRDRPIPTAMKKVVQYIWPLKALSIKTLYMRRNPTSKTGRQGTDQDQGSLQGKVVNQKSLVNILQYAGGSNMH